MNKKKAKGSSAYSIAGGFIAWMIGSGFATGQEIMQFFTSYGYWSYGILAINLVGFIIIGRSILYRGYLHREDPNFNIFVDYLGPRIGILYSRVVFASLLFLIPILVSGAGATLEEYFSLNKIIGSGLMSILLFISFCIGFEKLLKLLSFIGPLIILFSLVIASTSLISHPLSFDQVKGALPLLAKNQVGPFWFFSAVLYLSLSFLCGTAYYSALGQSAINEKAAKNGAVLGTVALIISIGIMNSAMLAQGNQTYTLAIPVLYLAQNVSPYLAGVFALILWLGIFSSSSAMMWTLCSRYHYLGKRTNTIIAAAIALYSFIIGLFPFRSLIGIIYPFIGFLGLFFIGRVIFVSVRMKVH